MSVSASMATLTAVWESTCERVRPATEDATLLLNADQEAVLGSLGVAAGKTFTIGGNTPEVSIQDLAGGDGSAIAYDGTLTVGGTIAPDGDAAATLAVTGNVAFDTGAALEVDLWGDAADRCPGGLPKPDRRLVAGSRPRGQHHRRKCTDARV